MFKIIKMLAALLLLVSLCLPLSKCTVQAGPMTKDQKERVVERYVAEIDQGSSPLNYLLVVPFVLPMLMVLFNIKSKREKLRYELLEILFGLMVFAVLMLHKLTGELMLGGYLAFSAAWAYLLSSMLESGITIKERFIDKKRC